MTLERQHALALLSDQLPTDVPVLLHAWTAADALSRTTPGNEIFRYVSENTSAVLDPGR